MQTSTYKKLLIYRAWATCGLAAVWDLASSLIGNSFGFFNSIENRSKTNSIYCGHAQVAQDEQLFALLLDSSHLHIYKDLYGENNDCFCNLWKCSDLNKNRLTLL